MRAAKIVHQMAAALGAAHAKGVVHRDLKPENVMLVDRMDDGGAGISTECVKVLDFGIAKLDVETVSAGNSSVRGSGVGGSGAGQPLTRMGAVFGTPDYMSPEQAMGQPVDARSDLYSIGIIFYELLTGVRPFRGGVVTVLRQHVLDDVPPLPLEVVAQLDPRVLGVLERLLAKTPEMRVASADELHAMLGEVIARPETPPPTVVDPQPFGTMATMMAGPAITTPGAAQGLTPSAPTAIAGLPAIVADLPPVRDVGRHQTRPAWALVAGLGVAALIGLVLVGLVLRSVLSKPEDGTNPASSISVSTKATAPIDLPPPPPPASAGGAGSGTGAGGVAGEDDPSPAETSTRATGAGTGGPRAAKDTKTGKPKARKTGPFGIYIPPPKEW
jgi:serine/threonine-protein kinase